mgnify:CR=1 FL=1
MCPTIVERTVTNCLHQRRQDDNGQRRVKRGHFLIELDNIRVKKKIQINEVKTSLHSIRNTITITIK